VCACKQTAPQPLKRTHTHQSMAVWSHSLCEQHSELGAITYEAWGCCRRLGRGWIAWAPCSYGLSLLLWGAVGCAAQSEPHLVPCSCQSPAP
jgi:hypothetical protein